MRNSLRHSILSGGDAELKEALDALGGNINCLPESELQQLFIKLLMHGPVEYLERLFSILSKAEGYSLGLSQEYADEEYARAFRYLIDHRTRDRIRDYNTPVIDEACINSFIKTLLRSESDLHDYIEKTASVIRERIQSEYKSVLALSTVPVFPYKYANDYSGKNIVKTSDESSPLSVEFIYCIKNRTERTTLSLRTLDAALRNYRSHGPGSLKVCARVVEDESHDILNLQSIGIKTLPVKQNLVRTGISWTRSGLLNIGIRKSKADLIAFVDADFMFHSGFLFGLERALRKIDLTANAIAVNLFESEAHVKDGVTYSKGSPYSYMWMAPRRTAKRISGFDEGYSGHGFEDRDFELKLTAVGELQICDTVSIDPDCFVIHLSHDVRTGDERRMINRDRFLKRRAYTDTKDLMQNKWGAFPEISRSHLNSKNNSEELNLSETRKSLRADYLFFPHNSYHAQTFLELRKRLRMRGFTSFLVNISPPHSDEGAFIPEYSEAYVSLAEVLSRSVSASTIVCMNDWEGKVCRPFVETANTFDIPTVAIVEGVNDFFDVDTRRNRQAYQRARHILLNGRFDQKYFSKSDQDIRVAGVQRLDPLSKKKSREKSDGRPKALVNINFSYGVLEDHRQQWLDDIIAACERCGYETILSQHRADTADLSSYNLSDRPLYELLDECSVFISRFSGAILEALRLGVNTIYYNSGFEQVDKFFNPLDAYIYASDQVDLDLALQFFDDGGNLSPDAFLLEHADIKAKNDCTSFEKTVDHLIEIGTRSVVHYDTFTNYIKSLNTFYSKRGLYAPEIQDHDVGRLLKKTTFGIKSFGRTRHLETLINSIMSKYPDAHILVCDDSGSVLEGLTDKVEVIYTEKDIGLSAGRNILLDNCDTEFFVLLDDDFIFTEETNIIRLIRALEVYDLDIAAGAVYDVGPSAQKKDQPRTFFGCLNLVNDQELVISTGKIRRTQNNIPLYDLVLNFFASRTDRLKEIRWNDELKLGEHLDFFMRAKQANLSISYFPDVIVNHYRDHSMNTEDYKSYRRRADEFHKKFKTMYGISKIYQNSDEIPG